MREGEREREGAISDSYVLRDPPCFSKKFPTTTLDSRNQPPINARENSEKRPPRGIWKRRILQSSSFGVYLYPTLITALAGHINLWNETQHLSNPFNFILTSIRFIIIINYPYPSIQIQKKNPCISKDLYSILIHLKYSVPSRPSSPYHPHHVGTS